MGSAGRHRLRVEHRSQIKTGAQSGELSVFEGGGGTGNMRSPVAGSTAVLADVQTARNDGGVWSSTRTGTNHPKVGAP